MPAPKKFHTLLNRALKKGLGSRFKELWWIQERPWELFVFLEGEDEVTLKWKLDPDMINGTPERNKLVAEKIAEAFIDHANHLPKSALRRVASGDFLD